MKVTHIHITRELEDAIRNELATQKERLPKLDEQGKVYTRGFIAALLWVLTTALDTEMSRSIE